jgi:hypothetical protein
MDCILEVDDVLNNLSYEQIFAIFSIEKLQESKKIVKHYIKNSLSWPEKYPIKLLEDYIKKYNLYIPPEYLLNLPNYREFGSASFQNLTGYCSSSEEGYIWIIQNATDELTPEALNNILHFKSKNVINAFLEKGYKLPSVKELAEIEFKSPFNCIDYR